VILYGSDYWASMLDWLRARVLEMNNISQEDVDSIHVVDDPERVRDIVVEYYRKAKRSGK
jgi:predicted Rossmann-fold nucleotide-binding protein